MTTRIPLLLFLAALPFAGCASNTGAPQSAPAPGSGRYGKPSTDDTVTFNAETGIRIMRSGVVSPKCRRATIFTVTEKCEGRDPAQCKAAAERESMIRAKDGGNNLVKVTDEGMEDGSYRISSQVFHCASDAFDLNTVPGAHHVN